MANLNLVVNSKFQPISFERYIKPYQLYGEAYKAIEDDYTNLALQTEAFKDEANRENNPDAFELYNKFSADLNAAIDDFSKDMTSSSRKKLLEMKRRYAGEILPIAKASEAMKEANAFRDKVGPDAIFEVGRYNSLDDFLHGKVANNKYTTMSQVAARAKEKAEAAADTIYGNLIKQGASPQTALAMMQNPNNNAFKGIYDSELEAVGANNYDSDGQSKINNAISIGINSALGKLAEREIMTAAQRDNSARAWAQLRESQRIHDIELAEKGYKRDKNGNFIKIDTPPEFPEYDSSINRFFISFAKDKSLAKDYLTKDGKLSPGAFNAEILFNKEGKFSKPESSEIKGVGKVAVMADRNKESIYNNIRNILINYGYTEEQISNMDKSTLEKALNDIANESTEAGRLTYRTSLDKNSTEFLFNKMQEMGYDFKSIEGFHKNEEGIYVPTIGGDAGITYADNSTGSILLDPSSKQFMLMYNGNYYNLPKDLISQDKANTLESVFGRKIDAKGEILPSDYEATNNYIQFIQDKRNKGEEITDREYKVYVAYLKKLQEMDSLMAEMGEKFVEYVGIKKTN